MCRRHNIDFSGEVLSRKDVKRAFYEVWKKGPKSAGADRVTWADYFGRGHRSTTYQQNLKLLLRRRHKFHLTRPRVVKKVNDQTGKVREITIPTHAERVLFRALKNKLEAVFPASGINVSRAGLDARWSVLRVSYHLQCKSLHALRLDIRKAFPSLDWLAIMAPLPTRGWRVPTEMRRVLIGILSFFSPGDRGIPLGLSFSPLLLDLACSKLDEQLEKEGLPAYRFVDDLVVLAQDPMRFNDIWEDAVEALAEFRMELHPDKSKPYLRRQSWPETGQESFPWLGHDIDLAGDIDVTEEAAANALAGIDSATALQGWQSSFVLAREGDRFRHAIEQLTERFTDSEHLNNEVNNSRRQAPTGQPSEEVLWPPAKRGRTWSPSRSRPSTLRSNQAPQGGQVPTKEASGTPASQESVSNQAHPGNIRRSTAPSRASEPSASGMEGGRRPSTKATEQRKRAGGNRRRGRGITPSPRRPIRPSTMLEAVQEFEGGRRGLLDLAQVLHRPYPYFDRLVAAAEARILLGVPLAKARQLGRAAQLWEQVLGVLDHEGRQLSLAEEEELLLGKAWPVLMAAATITTVRSVKFCVADPLVEIIEAIGGKPIRMCKAAIFKERKARENGQVPTRQTLYAALADNKKTVVEEPAISTGLSRFNATAANRRRGLEAEAEAARELGGRCVPCSGAGVEKGDITVEGWRFEVKYGDKRWRVPMYQIRQLVTSGDFPCVLLKTRGKPDLALVPFDEGTHGNGVVLEERKLKKAAKFVSFSILKHHRLLDDMPEGIFKVDCRLGCWALGRAISLLPHDQQEPEESKQGEPRWNVAHGVRPRDVGARWARSAGRRRPAGDHQPVVPGPEIRSTDDRAGGVPAPPAGEEQRLPGAAHRGHPGGALHRPGAADSPPHP